METAVRTESDFEHDPPVALFEYQSNNYRTGPQHNYAVSDAGDRFLLLKQDPETIAPPTYKIRIVQNWTNELERLVPTD